MIIYFINLKKIRADFEHILNPQAIGQAILRDKKNSRNESQCLVRMYHVVENLSSFDIGTLKKRYMKK